MSSLFVGAVIFVGTTSLAARVLTLGIKSQVLHWPRNSFSAWTTQTKYATQLETTFKTQWNCQNLKWGWLDEKWVAQSKLHFFAKNSQYRSRCV